METEGTQQQECKGNYEIAKQFVELLEIAFILEQTNKTFLRATTKRFCAQLLPAT